MASVPEGVVIKAIHKAKEYISAGNEYVVDIDLEKFFDRVNHDKLMSLIAKDILDKPITSLNKEIFGIRRNDRWTV